MARALYDDPAVLILDEPDAHLDGAGAEALNRAIAGHKARGGSAVVIAHRSGAFAECDHVLAMEQGRLHPARPTREIAGPTPQGNVLQVVKSGPPAGLAEPGRAGADGTGGACREQSGSPAVSRSPAGT